MRVTTFNAIMNDNKKPTSPYKQGTNLADCFEFVTHQLDTLDECFELLTKNWVLTNASCIEEPLLARRIKKNFTDIRCTKPGAVILDIDDIKTYDDMKKVIDFFKKSDFNIILGKSKNWDGKVKFNLKGFIEVDFTNDWITNRNFMNILNEMTTQGCTIDGSASTDTSVQAPINRNDILLNKQDSNASINNDWIEINSKYIKTKKENVFFQNFDSSKLLHVCYQIYSKKGFSVVTSRGETVNWQHPDEIKSKGGYFSYIATPHIMHHHNKEKSFNIFNEIKATKEGQEFLKEQSAFDLKKQFEEHKDVYKNQMVLNKQLLTIDKSMSSFIDKFLKDGDIFKIKSAMGTGKSIIINEIIDKAKQLNKKILLISNRISVAKDYSEKYSIKTYQNDTWKPGEHLIVQMDSLHHYDLRDFDLVILDEFVSLMFQSINSLQEDMIPFNISKFYYILKNKQIVMADAFLSGYEDCFYKSKEIYYINNEYRDKIDLTQYDSINTFVESLIDAVKNKKSNENVTASIMSLNVINTIYDIVEEMGYKVFKLTGTTSEDVKSTIYKLFEEDENDKWDLLLYSPTLTVGVSNMNNCTHHYHYDGSNSADTISSLQMVKRSRKMKHLHICMKQKIYLEPTEANTLNDLFNQNIEMNFKGSTNSIKIDVDENANFTLSKVGKFMNKILALYNRLENNHKLSFNVLLHDQFDFKETKVHGIGRLKFNKIMKKVKLKLQNESIGLVEGYNLEYRANIEEIIKSGRTLNENEKVELMLYELEQKMNTSDIDIIKHVAKSDIKNNHKLTSRILNLCILYRKDIMQINNDIDKLLSSGSNSKELKIRTNILKDFNKLFNYKLHQWYSLNDIKKVEEEFKLNNMKTVLREIGYKKVRERWVLDEDVKKYFKYFL
jgi:hypothetical protein